MSETKGQNKKTFCVDIGGVLLRHSDNSEKEEVLVDGCQEALAAIHKSGEYNIVILSFAGPKRAENTYQVIKKNLGQYISKYYFVKDKSFKVEIMKHINATVLIDDNADVISNVVKAGMKGILFNEEQKVSESQGGLFKVSEWKQVPSILSALTDKPSDKEITYQALVYTYDSKQRGWIDGNNKITFITGNKYKYKTMLYLPASLKAEVKTK